MQLPRPVRKLIESFERLPGIGLKTAQRLTFYLLHVPQEQLSEFADSLMGLKKNTVLCSICFNVAERDPCPICTDPSREKTLICVVEQPLDVLALEKTDKYKGLYHVLHGTISPLDNIGPDELYIKQLLDRLRFRESSGFPESGIREVILATNPTMEGEATSMYIRDQIRIKNLKFKISRLGQGLPTGGDLEYADEVTLSRALEGRREY